MADAPFRADPRALGDHGTQHLVGVQGALHQDLRGALVHQLHRPRRRRVAVFHIDDAVVRQVDPLLLGDRPNAPFGSHQHGDDEAVLGGLDGTL